MLAHYSNMDVWLRFHYRFISMTFVCIGLVGPHFLIPYSRKIWQGIKFGSLAVCMSNRQIKISQNFLLAYIRMSIPYQTAKFKSANMFAKAILFGTQLPNLIPANIYGYTVHSQHSLCFYILLHRSLNAQ